MSAKQNSKGVRWGRAVAHVGIACAYAALVTACSGSIEATDVDRTRSERVSNSPAPAGTTPAANAPAANAPAANAPAAPPASRPPASNPPPAANNPPPAAEPDPEEDEEEASPPAAGGGDLSFEADVYPILSSSCAGCHGASGFAGVSVADSDVEAALESAVADEERILSEIEAGDMPQGCGGPPGSGGVCLTEDEFDTLSAWYEAGAPE